MLLLNSTHHHAQMSRFDHNAHPLRSDRTLNRISDLRCESLLHLQSTSKDVHQARNFAESNYFSIRDIRDVDLAEERQKVVFAQTEHLNILDDHHFVVSYVEHRAQQNLLRALLVALGQILQTNQHFPHEVLQARTGQGLRFNYCLHLFTQFEIPPLRLGDRLTSVQTDYVFIASSSDNDVGTLFLSSVTLDASATLGQARKHKCG